jgi:hypothetical protein
MKLFARQATTAAALAAFLTGGSALLAQSAIEPQASRSLRITAQALNWQRQTPELATMISELWGNRHADGGSGSLLRLPPGFDSGLHAHSGDFHGVVVKGVMVHEGPNGEDRGTRLAPGSYMRQAGGEMHIDRCVSEEPCELFVFQYTRADIVWPGGRATP